MPRAVWPLAAKQKEAADAACRDGRHHRARAGRGPRCRRVQRHRHRARGGDRRGRRGRRRAGGAADQRELRRLPPRARARSPRPAWPSRAAPRCPSPCTWTTRQTWRSSRRRPGSGSARSCSTRPGCPTRRTSAPRPRSSARVTGGASGSRRSSARSAARTACTRRSPAPIPARRRATSRRPGWTRWRSRSAARTPWRPATRCSTWSLIARLRGAVSVPLVLHGSSGVPDPDLAAAVRAGMTKINIATQLNKVFTAAVRLFLSAEPAAIRSQEVRGGGTRRGRGGGGPAAPLAAIRDILHRRDRQDCRAARAGSEYRCAGRRHW